MGWTGSQYFGKGSRKDFLMQEFKSVSDKHTSWLTDVSMKGSVAYGIYWWKDETTSEERHEGIVILTSKRKNEPYWIYYKEMGETALPYYYDAPVSLIKKLNELGEPYNDNARQWRDRCLENAERAKIKVEVGTIIQFLQKMQFRSRSGSFEEDTFTLVNWVGNKKAFRTQTGQLCQITNWKKREYRVVGVQA